jgi:hypothetical protein
VIGILLATTVMALPVDAYAQTTHAVAIGGAGRDSCANWIKDREDTSQASKLANQQRIEWVSGFFSAVNLFTEASGNLTGGIDDLNGMLNGIDTHCRAAPNKPLWAAAGDLVLELKNKPHPPKL